VNSYSSDPKPLSIQPLDPTQTHHPCSRATLLTRSPQVQGPSARARVALVHYDRRSDHHRVDPLRSDSVQDRLGPHRQDRHQADPDDCECAASIPIYRHTLSLRLRRGSIRLPPTCRSIVDLIDSVQIESQVPPLCIAIGVSQQPWYSSLSPRHRYGPGHRRHCRRVLIRLQFMSEFVRTPSNLLGAMFQVSEAPATLAFRVHSHSLASARASPGCLDD
jgi:hypothetical protein